MRWLDPEVTTAATFTPVVLSDAKSHLKVDDTASDTLITSYIAAATDFVEQYTGLRLATQTVKLRARAFDESEFVIPAAPITAVTGVTYTDTTGATQTLDPSYYVTSLAGLRPKLALAYDKTWPAHREGPGFVTLTVTCGYADGAAPAAIRQAILLIVGDWFANRETVVVGTVSAPISMTAPVAALLSNYRR